MEPDGEAFDVEDRLDRAVTALRRERRRTADELEALGVFAERVREIEAETAVAEGNAVAAVGLEAARTDGLDAVREAYEATVMSVPHYGQEYDDGYPESLRAEFSPDLAAALTDGTRFNARCKRAVLSATESSRSARGSLLGTLSTESESLAAAAATLPSVAREVSEFAARSTAEAPFGTLDAHRARLSVLEGKCETVADERQSTLFEQRRTTNLPSGTPDVPQYVYQELPFDYPVMAAVADLTGAIEAVRDDLRWALARA